MQFLIDNLKENCLLLQLLINFSHTIDTRIEKHSPKRCDCGNMFEICLQPPILIKFRFQFTQKCNFSRKLQSLLFATFAVNCRKTYAAYTKWILLYDFQLTL